MEGKKGADVVALLASTLWGEDQCRPPCRGPAIRGRTRRMLRGGLSPARPRAPATAISSTARGPLRRSRSAAGQMG